MKKFLIAATALAFMSGVAAAQTMQPNTPKAAGTDRPAAAGNSGAGIRNLEGNTTGQAPAKLTNSQTKPNGKPLNDNRGSQPGP